VWRCAISLYDVLLTCDTKSDGPSRILEAKHNRVHCIHMLCGKYFAELGVESSFHSGAAYISVNLLGCGAIKFENG
jgi:hypothetical protein